MLAIDYNSNVGQISMGEAERLLKILAIEEIGNLARIDVGREFRKGIPEVILAEGKRPEDVAEIALKMLNEKGRAIISRAGKEQIDAIKRPLPMTYFYKLTIKLGW